MPAGQSSVIPRVSTAIRRQSLERAATAVAGNSRHRRRRRRAVDGDGPCDSRRTRFTAVRRPGHLPVVRRIRRQPGEIAVREIEQPDVAVAAVGIGDDHRRLLFVRRESNLGVGAFRAERRPGAARAIVPGHLAAASQGRTVREDGTVGRRAERRRRTGGQMAHGGRHRHGFAGERQRVGVEALRSTWRRAQDQ